MYTQEQREKFIKQYAVNEMSKGWEVEKGALTAPRGYVWIWNVKSRFYPIGNPKFKHALIKKELIN